MNVNSSMMNPWLTKATAQLEAAGIGTARLDCLILLEDITGKDRTHLLAHPELELSIEQQNHLQKLLERRARHEPLAYIREKTEFYGREFYINNHVLEPRPESETMFDLLLTYHLEEDIHPALRIADIGSGSGALGITAACVFGMSHVDLFEIDPLALAVSELNNKKLQIGARCILSDLFSAAEDTILYDVILANLPYVPNDHAINEAAANEPRLAIFGGEDGLDLYRRLFAQVRAHLSPQGKLLTESLPFQHIALEYIAAEHHLKQIDEQDFIQVFERRD